MKKILTLLFFRFYKNLTYMLNQLLPLAVIVIILIIGASDNHNLVGEVQSNFMKVTYCQPIDNDWTNNISELANAEVIIKPEGGEDSNVKVTLDNEKNKVNVVANLESEHLKTALSHLGAGTAAGYVGAAVIKSMQSSSIPAKLAAGAIGAGVTGATFILGSKAADVAFENVVKKNEASTSSQKLEEVPTTPTESIPFPQVPKEGGKSLEGDVFSASSLLDSVESDIPLISMINILFEFINMELLLLLVLIFLILKQRFKIGTKIFTFIKNKIPQDKPYQIKIHNLLDKLITGNNQVDQLLIITYLFLMLMVKLVTLYFMLDLKVNIDDYVYVYNKIKKIID